VAFGASAGFADFPGFDGAATFAGLVGAGGALVATGLVGLLGVGGAVFFREGEGGLCFVDFVGGAAFFGAAALGLARVAAALAVAAFFGFADFAAVFAVFGAGRAAFFFPATGFEPPRGARPAALSGAAFRVGGGH
jgi:hypothetical protein